MREYQSLDEYMTDNGLSNIALARRMVVRGHCDVSYQKALSEQAKKISKWRRRTCDPRPDEIPKIREATTGMVSYEQIYEGGV